MNSTDAGRQLIYTSRSYQSGNADARAKRMRRAPEATAASATSCVRQFQQYGHGGWVVSVENLLCQSRP